MLLCHLTCIVPPETVSSILEASWSRCVEGLGTMSRRRVEDGCQQLSQSASRLQSVLDLYNAEKPI